jgi:hypothetical protein
VLGQDRRVDQIGVGDRWPEADALGPPGDGEEDRPGRFEEQIVENAEGVEAQVFRQSRQRDIIAVRTITWQADT